MSVAGSGGRLARLRRRGARYWLVTLILIAVGYQIDRWLEDSPSWVRFRYALYQRFMDVDLREPLVTPPTVVLIGDEEYWKGELAGRAPIRRDYLARLLRQLDAANAQVVGLDLDLRSPVPGQPEEGRTAYAAEEAEFLAAVTDVAKRRGVVLPSTVWRNGAGQYIHEPDIYDSLIAAGVPVETGFIVLPPDLRRVPLRIPLADGRTQESFAVAVARQSSQALINTIFKDPRAAFPYGRFTPRSQFPTVSAEAVLDSLDGVRSKLAFKIVIVGGGWSSLAFGRGKTVDSHFTPIGDIPGVYLEANYVEAVLNRRVLSAVVDWWIDVGYFVLALACAVGLALADPQRLWEVPLLSVGCVFLLLIAGLLLIQLLGIYADFGVPLLLVVARALYDWLAERRQLGGAAPLAGTSGGSS